MKKIVFLLMVVGLVGIVGCDGQKCDGQNYVDLGLSSGTLWNDVNAKGHYTWDEANELFGDKMPSKEQWEELKRECKWTWEKGESAETTGMRVTGPNGKSIFLPAAGCRRVTEVDGVGVGGAYWSSTYVNEDAAYNMNFCDVIIYVGYIYRYYGLSVRLVRD